MQYDAVLFDFFGTLVRFTPVPAADGYERSHDVLGSLGSDLDYDGFVSRWNVCSEALEAIALSTGREHSMDELITGFLEETGAASDQSAVDRFRLAFLDEWCLAASVTPISGAVDLLAGLAETTTVAVVTNTHDLDLVPRLLDEHRLAPHVTETVMSVEVGYRKPHDAIYRAAVERLGVEPHRCLFVGDSFDPDYVGPTRFGMQALLIDPNATTAVPVERRIDSVLDVARCLDTSR